MSKTRTVGADICSHARIGRREHVDLCRWLLIASRHRFSGWEITRLAKLTRLAPLLEGLWTDYEIYCHNSGF